MRRSMAIRRTTRRGVNRIEIVIAGAVVGLLVLLGLRMCGVRVGSAAPASSAPR